jgi:signal peptide peptidase-like protein 2B
MTVETAFCYLLVATVGLVGLFLLIQQDARAVVFVMIGVFSMATLQVVTSLGTYPIVCRIAPDLDNRTVVIPCQGPTSLAWLVGFSATLVVVAVWVVYRHAGFAWLLQDTFAIFVCCQFVQVLRLNSIKVSYALLVSFMVYDIFMVFISPAIFKSSVMVTVAQAGTGSTSISAADPFTCVRIPDERMPMLFMLPRIGAEGEYAMLGLGDVLLPGLLLSFMLRYDTLAFRDSRAGCGLFHVCRRYPYWTVGILGYIVGLLLAFLANTFGFTIFEVRGQPALLYLVPCTLIPFTIMALIRGEFGAMWDGPPALLLSQPPPPTATTSAAEGRSLLKQEAV